jgi:molecular chaperone GrpE (heat shock protein)
MDEAQKKKDKEASDLTSRQEKETRLARIEYTKQVKENEATVVRYRKMIEDEKEFAITKFAKDLLEVRDAVRMSIEHFDTEGVKNEEDIAALKEKFLGTMEGQ